MRPENGPKPLTPNATLTKKLLEKGEPPNICSKSQQSQNTLQEEELLAARGRLEKAGVDVGSHQKLACACCWSMAPHEPLEKPRVDA